LVVARSEKDACSVPPPPPPPPPLAAAAVTLRVDCRLEDCVTLGSDVPAPPRTLALVLGTAAEAPAGPAGPRPSRRWRVLRTVTSFS
jgi:hypothetical protein